MWVADLGDTAAIGELGRQAWDALGGIDVLINNAAVPKRRVNFFTPMRPSSSSTLPPAVAHQKGADSKHDLQARPIYHHIRESIEADLSIVVAAMAVSHWIQGPNRLEHQEIRAHRPPLPHRPHQGQRTNTDAADPLPDDFREALIKIRAGGVH